MIHMISMKGELFLKKIFFNRFQREERDRGEKEKKSTNCLLMGLD